MLSTSVPIGRPQKQSSVSLNFPNENLFPAMRPLVKTFDHLLKAKYTVSSSGRSTATNTHNGNHFAARRYNTLMRRMLQACVITSVCLSVSHKSVLYKND